MIPPFAEFFRSGVCLSFREVNVSSMSCCAALPTTLDGVIKVSMHGRCILQEYFDTFHG